MSQLTTTASKVYELTRYNLVKNLCVFFIAVLSLTSLINFLNPNYNPVPDVFAVAVAVVCLITLLKTKNYRLVAMLGSSAILLIIAGAFFQLKALHYTTPGWMMVNILFVYFVLGNRWGIVMLMVHFSVFFAYLFLHHSENVRTAIRYTTADVWVFVIEYLIIAVAMAYLLYLFMVTSDFSERKLLNNNRLLGEQNKLIRKQNAEMEVMLKEIHHRVKNNLQIISSLLRLQSEKDVKESSEMFREAIDRVNAIAMIHERIYKTDALSDFDMRSYLDTLVRHLLDSYTLHYPVNVSMEVKVDEICTECLVPISLLFNELISNSLKHAFACQQAPAIHIRLEKAANEQFFVHYEDNGRWRDSGKPSFGTELIEAMTQQMEGSYTRESAATHTRYSFLLKGRKL